jgi:hypothetical protein
VADDRADLAQIVYRVNSPMYGDYDTHEDTADAILAAGWTPPPRVYLEGDEIPSHLPVIDNHGEVRDDYQDYDEGDGEVYTANFDVVEMNIDYDAAVARARQARGVRNPRASRVEER